MLVYTKVFFLDNRPQYGAKILRRLQYKQAPRLAFHVSKMFPTCGSYLLQMIHVITSLSICKSQGDRSLITYTRPLTLALHLHLVGRCKMAYYRCIMYLICIQRACYQVSFVFLNGGAFLKKEVPSPMNILLLDMFRLFLKNSHDTWQTTTHYHRNFIYLFIFVND